MGHECGEGFIHDATVSLRYRMSGSQPSGPGKLWENEQQRLQGKRSLMCLQRGKVSGVEEKGAKRQANEVQVSKGNEQG